MNRYPLWKYLLIAFALLFGLLYSVPNFFGQSPAVQVSSGKATIKVEPALLDRVNKLLADAGLQPEATVYEATQTGGTVRVRFHDTDTQLKAKDAIQKALAPDADDADYVVALNLVTDTPVWMQSIHALPMYLGLDLRGGVHFLMQVDTKAALAKKLEALQSDLRLQLREKNIRHAGIARSGDGVTIAFTTDEQRQRARDLLLGNFKDFTITEAGEGSELKLVATLGEKALRAAQDAAVKQNMTTLHNRVNELGVAEPVVQQQGADRIVVELPGVQDVAQAKKILGRTATLEVRLVDDSPEAQQALASGSVPFGLERYVERGGRPLLLKKEVVLTGDNLQDAQAGFSSEQQIPAVHLTLDGKGANIFRTVTRENLKKRMAIVLIEKGRGEVITAPVIQSEISGGRVQISGAMTTQEANELALLLRSGSLAAPMEIVEERTIGPSLGADNIAKGFHSVLWGFVAIAVFMAVYYAMFGLFSVAALVCNLMLLVALLSIMQATLTLPGIAAIALTLGMAIDANVLINERVREELRQGLHPQQAIKAGYDNAWATILDSNVTTLIAGVALLIFGSGPIRGFAVVHCLGILTSMFSAILVSRALVNLVYGRQRKLQTVAIGTLWKSESGAKA
ncbi:protein translocase subunit SecD [Derxia gummosa]|uniref:Protein translocase subunit SecD n=1 Tax=Derxia gummosa DSM 723 TaxID=1121388 RepID=A0A8B6X7D6_9BURK|nr:protein translocase subunit SecD [Derxia gummosa]